MDFEERIRMTETNLAVLRVDVTRLRMEVGLLILWSSLLFAAVIGLALWR